MPETMRPNISTLIVCDDIRQEMGGKISLMGLFESIYATQFPAFHPRLAVFTEWVEGQGEFELKMQISSPDKKTVLRETRSKISMPNPGMRHRDISVHLNLEFRAPGTYWIEHYLDGEMINSIPLEIVHVREQDIH
ncbi:MAG: hypothetical protein EPN25_11180 [Nitrospirae bacterium]|nr:MAG: hypothetical protein EPN25_11180 [Nitrospirota bacterium]